MPPYPVSVQGASIGKCKYFIRELLVTSHQLLVRLSHLPLALLCLEQTLLLEGVVGGPWPGWREGTKKEERLQNVRVDSADLWLQKGVF